MRYTNVFCDKFFFNNLVVIAGTPSSNRDTAKEWGRKRLQYAKHAFSLEDIISWIESL